MRWVPGSGRNVEDRRAGGGMVPMGIGGTVVLLILSLVFGRDFISGSGGEVAPSQSAGGEVQQTPEEAKQVQFVSFVLDSTQATWSRLLPQSLGAEWHDANLVLYRQATQTACGLLNT